MILKTQSPRSRPDPLAQQQIADLLGAGLAQHQAGNLQRARETYRFILTIDPHQADALHFLGVSFLDDHPGEAEALIRRAISASPRNPLYYANLGLALRRQQRFEDALAMYDKALRRKPDYREAHLNRGLSLLSLQRTADALAAFGRALAHSPNYAEALKFRADALSDLRRFAEALADYDRLIAIVPDDPGTLNNRGMALLELKRHDEALASVDAALVAAPDTPDILNSRGVILKAMGRLDDALACFGRAASIAPAHVEAIANRGSTLQDLARYDEALASYADAQRLQPEHAIAHWNEATLRLLTGDLARGFAKAEWRMKVPALQLTRADFAQPLWLGETPLEGKTILVHADLGLGDTIHFARYIPMLAGRGARVIAQVQASMKRLIGAMPSVALCVCKDDPLPAFDLHCPLSSLPLAFGTTLDSIPADIPYLSAPALPDAWRERLGTGRTKIGLVWSGNASHVNDRNRSIPLQALQPLLDCDATFVGLQTELRAGDAEILHSRTNLVAGGQFLADFADTAALVSALDLVITVDTSVAHLAGALGRPAWILLPFVPDWRWLLNRDDSPWYPAARLFRQTADRHWGPVIERVRAALKAELSP